jgi:hypothetical protein
LRELASPAEPGPELRAGIQTITRRHPYRCTGRREELTFVPPVDTTTDLPPNDSTRPISNLDLQ